MKKARLKSLLLNQHEYINLLDDKVIIETDGGYGELCRAVDKGEPTMGLLDCIDAEHALGLIKEDDEAAWAAALLAMCGAKPEQLGGLFHPRLSKNRTGRRMLEDAALMASVRAREAGTA